MRAPGASAGMRFRERETPFLWFGLYPSPQTITQLDKPSIEAISMLNWKPITDRTTYNIALEQIRNYIGEGQTYQIKYTMRLQADFTSRKWDFLLQLAQNQNKYVAYIDTDRYVIGSSPAFSFTTCLKTLWYPI